MAFLPACGNRLVGGDDGAQTVITNFHAAHALDEANARAMAQEHYGVGENAKVELELRIIVKRDVLIGATIVNTPDSGGQQWCRNDSGGFCSGISGNRTGL